MGMYRAMRDRFGHQSWWPATHSRHTGEDGTWEICVGAILTQNTNWRNVERALRNLAAAGCLAGAGAPAALRALGPARLARLIRPAGYFNVKARRLLALAGRVCRTADGDIHTFLQGPETAGRTKAPAGSASEPAGDTDPPLRDELLAVNGIGPETADSILLYAAGRCVFVIDAYTRRVFLRHRLIAQTDTYEDVRAMFQTALPRDVELWKDYHAQVVAVGKDYCRPRAPRCDACPLRRFAHDPGAAPAAPRPPSQFPNRDGHVPSSKRRRPMTTCQAIAFTARETAELVPVEPAEAGAGQVAGPTLCTLVSPGTELSWGYTGETFPARPGYAAVFRVEQVGPDTGDAAPGELRFCMGNHAGWQCVPVSESLPLPDGLPPARAVLARLMGVSMSTLTTTPARPGDPVAVTGLGPVGLLCARILAIGGFDVTGVEPDAPRREQAGRCGTGRTLASLDDLPEELAGHLALVAECSGREQAVLDACRAVRPRGEVVLIGVPWARTADVQAFDLLHAVFHKYAVVRSGWEWELPRHPGHFQPHSIWGNFATALTWLAEGRVFPTGVHTSTGTDPAAAADMLIREHAPTNAQEVYQSLLHRRAAGLFQVFRWSE